MSGIEKVSLGISKNIGMKLCKNDEEIAVINYGIFVILHTSITIICMLIIGVITRSTVEIMTIAVCSAVLKRYSGGIHARTPFRCLVLGVSMATIFTYCTKIIVNRFNLIQFTMFLVLSIVISYYVLYRRCPIGSKQKPLKNETKRRQLRKKSFEIMAIFMIFIFIFYIVYIVLYEEIFKSLCTSIVFGILVQVFALSKIGEKIIINTEKI